MLWFATELEGKPRAYESTSRCTSSRPAMTTPQKNVLNCSIWSDGGCFLGQDRIETEQPRVQLRLLRADGRAAVHEHVQEQARGDLQSIEYSAPGAEWRCLRLEHAGAGAQRIDRRAIDADIG